jgi:PPP family 3-phenylpropionic acid transporter
MKKWQKHKKRIIVEKDKKLKGERMKNNVFVKFSAMGALYWGMFACFAVYIQAFGLSRGYSQSYISLIAAIYAVAAFGGQFFWGAACDKIGSNRKVFLVSLPITCIIQYGIYLSGNELLFAVLYALLGFSLGPLGSVRDTWMFRAMKFDQDLYGKASAMGTAGYAVMILIMGNVIKVFGYIVMPFSMTAVAIAVWTIAWSLEDAPGVEKKPGSSVKIGDIMSILKIPAFISLVFMLFLFGFETAPISGMKIVVLEAVGGDVSVQGIDGFVGCISQFVLFMSMGKIRKLTPKARLFVSSVIILTGVIINYMATAPWMVIIGTFLFFGSYSFIMSASREIVVRSVKYEYQTTANGIADASYNNLSSMLALLMVSALTESIGIKNIMIISLVLSVIQTVCLGIIMVKKSGKEIEGND